ncbi:hypothetical protein C8R45DRAFT_1115406 [Mycena sanguinolenta]|nr:hypothetical protein C8R45DRAFT_1115406 [Mycena sanguinolenta]
MHNAHGAPATRLGHANCELCLRTCGPFNLPRIPQLTTLELKPLPGPRALAPPWLPLSLAQLLGVLPALHTLILDVTIESYSQTLLPQATAALAAFDAIVATSGSLSRYIRNLFLHRPYGTYRTILEHNLVRLREADVLEVRYFAQVNYERSLP